MKDLNTIIDLIGEERYDRFNQLVLLDEEDLVEWFNSPNEAFNDRTPYQGIVSNGFAVYDSLLYNLESGEPLN